MTVKRKRRYRGFQHQLIRESVIATCGLCVIAAASFGWSGRSGTDAPGVEEPRVLPAQPVKEANALQHRDFFDGRPIRRRGTAKMRVTAYSPDERSCGPFADAITASGYSVRTNGGDLVAADTNLLPFGSLLSIPGYAGGDVVPVLDRGSAIIGRRLDVLFPTHEAAMAWGVRTLEVGIWEYADMGPAGKRLARR